MSKESTSATRIGCATPERGVIAALPCAEVRQAKIGDTEPLMTLEETLESFPETRFNIDIKTDHALEPTLALVKRMGVLNRICLASFSDARLVRIRKRFDPAVCLGAGPRDVAALRLASWGPPVMRAGCQCAQVPLKEYGIAIATRRLVRYCNAKGVAVHVWTIDKADQMRRLIRLGFNGVMTDRPSLLKRIAQEEGVW